MTAENADATPSESPLLRAALALECSRRTWLGTHFDPDGDAVGSMLGLAWILRGVGKTVEISCQDPPPAELQFLPGADWIAAARLANCDVAVALDAADFDRLGSVVSLERWQAAQTIVLDHHASNLGFADINVIDHAHASTAEIVVRLADAMDAPIGADAATCLLAGIVTDTLGFRTANTRPATLECARRMIELGASLADITQRVFYSRPLAHLQLLGRAIARLKVDGRLGIAALPLSDFTELQVSPAEVRGVSSLLITARELDALALLRERSDGTIDVSLRSKPGTDLMPVAASLGGGGHPQAAGASIDGPLEAAAERVLAALHQVVGRAGGPAQTAP